MEARIRARPMTVEEYTQVSDEHYRHELQAGILVSEPRPFPRHARVQLQTARALSEFVAPRGLGVVFTDAGFLLSRNPDTVRGPDVSFVRRDRYDPESEAVQFFPGAPDLAVEILSASNRPGEIHAKVADYLAAGSTLVWVIDPEARCADVYRTLLAPRRISASEHLDGEDVLPGFSARLDSMLDL